MADVEVAFLWHYHQPDYREPATGEALLPWVRLHGVKDYYAMAKIAAEFPEVKLNFNLVPSMLDQILQIADGGKDAYLQCSRKAAAELTEEERAFLLKEFFSVNWRTLVEMFPGYRELLELSGKKKGEPAGEALRRFGEQELRDLQVWFNLVWFHPYSREKEELVAELITKGRGFTEEEKNQLLDLQLKLLNEVIPLYRQLADSGQAELTTSPYYHPIMPLLCDVEIAHEAMAGAPLPLDFPRVPEDAATQMRKAVERHGELFGARPRGCWPSEGAVSTQVIEVLTNAGIEWCATDEEILAATLSRSGKHVRLDGPDRGSLLYRAYRADSGRRSVKVIFRDHYLSDLIGFTYYTYEPKAAAADFINHLHRIADIASGSGPGTWIVPVILDGENPWEAYAGGGLTFLRELYGLLSVSKRVRTTRVCDYLENAEPQMLNGLFPGSWIGHNFKVWIGEKDNNKAWDYLGRARKVLAASGGTVSEEARKAAWEQLYKAEGSDWFWWYSQQHSSPHDEFFDALFRGHLKSVYETIGKEVPVFLQEPIVEGGKAFYTDPYALLDVRIDGRRSDYFEWLCAGHYDPAHDQGAIARPAGSAVKEIHFGFDVENFYLRIDLAGDATELAGASFVLDFVEPRPVELKAESLREGALRAGGKAVGRMAAAKFVELSVPFAELQIEPGQRARFQLEFSSPDGMAERLPFSGPIAFAAPTENFDLVQWQA